MLIAAVRRVKEPGCKFDYIVVLEGEQGIGKSSVLKNFGWRGPTEERTARGYSRRVDI
jgi:predicted P-loop ATPase